MFLEMEILSNIQCFSKKITQNVTSSLLVFQVEAVLMLVPRNLLQSPVVASENFTNSLLRNQNRLCRLPHSNRQLWPISFSLSTRKGKPYDYLTVVVFLLFHRRLLVNITFDLLEWIYSVDPGIDLSGQTNYHKIWY